MRRATLAVIFLSLGCAGTGLEGRAVRPVRGPWGAGEPAGPVKYLDWSLGYVYSVKNWADRGADENVWFPAYDVSFIHHSGYSWDTEFSTWFGRFVHPTHGWKVQSIVYALSVRYTRPVGLGWWHVSAGAGYADNDNTDAHDVPVARAAAGYTYPLPLRLNLGLSVGYIWNDTHHLDRWGGAPIDLSVFSAGVSLATSF